MVKNLVFFILNGKNPKLFAQLHLRFLLHMLTNRYSSCNWLMKVKITKNINQNNNTGYFIENSNLNFILLP